MNILLMSMPDVCPGYPSYVMKTPNIALSSIAANLDRRHKVTIADLILKRQNLRKSLIESLKESNPEIVGLSSMTYQYNTALRVAKFIKNYNPHIKIAFGGYQATLLFKEIANSDDGQYFDFIFRGESDLSFNEAVDKLENGEDLKTVHGLSFRKNKKFTHNRKRKLEDLNQIKSPDRSSRLWKGYHIMGIPVDLIESSRGCTMACNFCNIRNMFGKSFRKYEIPRIIVDIENALLVNLIQLKKGNIVNHSIQAVKYLKDNGILVSGGLIIGNPDDNDKDIEENYKFIKNLNVDFAGIQFLTPYPKTPIRKKLIKEGLLTNVHNYKMYSSNFPNIRTKYLSDDQLSFLKYKMSNKYIKTREVNALKAIIRKKWVCLRLLKGRILRMIPVWIFILISSKIKSLFLNEKQAYLLYLNKDSKFNQFNIVQ